MKPLDVIAAILLVIGGLNWGLVGLLDFNLVKAIFGEGAFARIIYTIVGLAAVYDVILWKAIQKRWCAK